MRSYSIDRISWITVVWYR